MTSLLSRAVKPMFDVWPRFRHGCQWTTPVIMALILTLLHSEVSDGVQTAAEVEAAILEAINTGPIHQVEAVLGSRAELPCDVAPEKPGDILSLVLWYKDAIGNPVYSYDSRGISGAPLRDWKGLGAKGDRVVFDTDASPSALVVKDLQKEDQGLYRCRVDFKKTATRNVRTNLTVIVPPEPPVIVEHTGQQVWTMVGPFDEGDKLDLTCRVSGGEPVPKVRWRMGHKVLDEDYQKLQPGLVVNQLIIPKLERKHLHAALACEAVNTNSSAPFTARVTIEMNLKPLTVQMLGPREPLSASRSYEIECQSAGARPAATITWWLDNVELRNATTPPASSSNVTVSSLQFEPKPSHAGKQLKCKAESPDIHHPALEDNWLLEVFYTPDVHLTLGSNLEPDSIREGEDVYFECNVKAKPKIYKVVWYHNGELVKHNVSAGVIVSNQSLVLQKVQRLQTGLYTCIASNSEGDGESNALNLSVQYTPVCVPGQIQTYSAARHEEVTVTCQIDAVPPIVTFNWRFNSSGDVVEIADTHIASAGLKSSLSYVARTELDYGTLQCWGTNPLGKQKIPCKFRVIPAERPDPPKNCSLLNDSTDSLTIKCSPGYNGGLHQTFVVEVYDVESERLLLNITENDPYFQLVGLEAGTSFVANVYAVNSRGPSKKIFLEGYTDRDFTERRIAQVRHPPMSKVPKEIPFAQLLGIGLGVLGSLVLFIVVAVLLHRLKKENRRPKMQKNSLQTSLSDCREENPDVIPNSDSETNLPCGTAEGGFHEVTLPPPPPYATSLYTTLPRRHEQNEKGSTSQIDLQHHLLYAEMMPHDKSSGGISTGALCGSLPRGSHMPSISSHVGKIEQHSVHQPLRPSQSMLMQAGGAVVVSGGQMIGGAGQHFSTSPVNLMAPHHHSVVSVTSTLPHAVAPCQQQQRHSRPQRQPTNSKCTHDPRTQEQSVRYATAASGSPTVSFHNQHLLNYHHGPNSPSSITEGGARTKDCRHPQQQQGPTGVTQHQIQQQQQQQARYSPQPPQPWVKGCCVGQYDNMLPSRDTGLNTISYAQAHSIPLSGDSYVDAERRAVANAPQPPPASSSAELQRQTQGGVSLAPARSEKKPSGMSCDALQSCGSKTDSRSSEMLIPKDQKTNKV